MNEIFTSFFIGPGGSFYFRGSKRGSMSPELDIRGRAILSQLDMISPGDRLPCLFMSLWSVILLRISCSCWASEGLITRRNLAFWKKKKLRVKNPVAVERNALLSFLNKLE